MSLQLILGKSGAGKSYQLYQKIISESIKNPDKKYFVVVPEQFTMQTQKDLVSMHPNHGICNIDVLSFMRLAYRVFEEQGKMKRTVLEDTGKSMLVRKVIAEKKDELVVFQNNVRKTGYVSEIKSLLSEFYQYDIKEQAIEAMIAAAEKKPILKQKLKDMQVIYKGFEEKLEEKYITAEEILDVLADAVEASSLLEGSVLALDGFTGFTPVQYKLLHKLFKRCEDVMVSVTIDPKEDKRFQQEEFQLFHSSRQMIERLYQIAGDEGMKIAKDYAVAEDIPYRFKNSPYLACLEEQIFRHSKSDFTDYCKRHQVTPETKAIALFAGKDMQGEVDYAVREISKLLREDGYRYRDIAIVTGDMEGYSRLVEKAFAKAGFPCFIDYKKDIMSNPLVELIRTLLEIFRKNFDYESMFRYLRCGLVDMEEEKVDKLENYVIALGIKGKKRWQKLWNRTYRKDIEIDIEEINESREQIVNGLEQIGAVFGKKENTVKTYTIALHGYLVEHEIYRKIKAYEEFFSEQNMPLLAKEYSQVYEIVLGIFDKLVQLLGDEKVTLFEYADLLETGFVEAKVGLIPPGVDQIVVGDIERTRLKDIKALFFLGVNDGVVPKHGGKGGIISDLEREMLHENKFELAPTVRQSAYTQEFYFYLNLTKPQERLFITYHKTDQAGKPTLPSYLIETIRKIFPELSLREEHSYKTDEKAVKEELEEILSGDFGKRYLLNGLGRFGQEELADWWKELFSFYKKQEGWQAKLEQLIEAVGFVNTEHSLSMQVAEGIYGKQLDNSVTRVEKYAACAFAHFLQYGLQLKERYEFQFGGIDFGNIFHEVLELFPKKLKEQNLIWREIQEEMFAIADQCVKEATADYGNAILTSSNKNAYFVERITRIVKRTLWALTEQLKQGDFEPTDFEVTFNFMDGVEAAKIQLGEEQTMRLRGKIDRVDTFDEKDAIYVKILDYKSGKTTFQIENLYYGLQMQLVVYMNAAMELQKQKHPDKHVIPAGIFYYNMDDPMIERPEESDAETIAQELLKELKMNGLVNSDRHVIQLLDKHFGKEDSLEASVQSKVIPVATLKSGELKAGSKVANTEQLELMGAYAEKKIEQFGREILDGEVAINPYRMKEKTACDYCSFRAVCNFDPKLPGNGYRNLNGFNKSDEVWEKMKEQVKGGDTDGTEE